ncbi:hypothetical protein HJC23_000325 [Cyclotella cryptica]|uniref:SET domain-containing protein n=1 Tax=Cyclotella cryptica TaxID=29204 RepID=A0ABD3P6T0_9STRA
MTTAFHSRRGPLTLLWTFLAASSGPSQSIARDFLRVSTASFLLSASASRAQESCHASDETCRQPQHDQHDETVYWHNYSIDELFDHFGCHSILPSYAHDEDDDEVDPPRLAPQSVDELALKPHELADTMRMLEQMRVKYQTEINAVSIPNKEDATSVFRVPVFVGDAGHKGRGIFAAESIQKGSLVLSIDVDNVGIFKDPMEWRRFTYTLGNTDAETACNFMEWCWVQHVPKLDDEEDDIRHGWTVFIAFDESGLVNNAEWGAENENIRCGIPPPSTAEESTYSSSGEDRDNELWGPCRYHYYATRDIAPGEELLIKYSEFEDKSQVGWVEFGVGAIVIESQ